MDAEEGMQIVEWHYMPQVRPGIATSSDGRVKVWDENACLVLPAPAAKILEDIEARRFAGAPHPVRWP